MFEIEEDYPATTVEEVRAAIADHEASHLVTIERNDVNGYVTFRFYAENDALAGKLTFDELSDDMADRAKGVLDFLSSTEHVPLYQTDVEERWEAAAFAATPC